MQSARPTPQRTTRRSAPSPSPSANPHPALHLPTTATPSASLSASKKKLNNSILSPPPLPLHKFNPLLVNFTGRLRSVRTQQISISDAHSITIARIKIPAPAGAAAHLIKRFDTDAVSASSFFKTAFPTASDDEEDRQMAYLQSVYDTARAAASHLGPDHKLTGVWVPTEHAHALATAYGLAHFAAPLIAHPNPNPTPTPDPPSKPLSPAPTTKAERSAKRARVAPPSFGSTSPSTFTLSLPPPPAPAPAPAPEHEHEQPIDGLPAPDEHPEEPPTVSGDEAERPNPGPPTTPKSATTRLIGTDADAARAQKDALSLVQDLRNAHPPSSESPLVDGTVKKKRSLEDPPAEDSQNRSLLSRLWNKKQSGTRAVRRPKLGLPHTIGAAVGTEDALSKRNLAVAGIFIAGAAASIAPYFF